ncbi:hypothetical protein NHP21005_14900 [Helicobacter sp. NHP21005]|nr:hypothetical protein NHP21005_14900 [Helicobacter sp. NHP21005]
MYHYRKSVLDRLLALCSVYLKMCPSFFIAVKQNRHKCVGRSDGQVTQQIDIGFDEFAVNVHEFTRVVVVIVCISK